jgi:hypothetical protein
MNKKSYEHIIFVENKNEFFFDETGSGTLLEVVEGGS